MTYAAAFRLTEILLCLALIQQGLEHLKGGKAERRLFLIRTALCVLVILGISSPWPLAAMAVLSLFILHRFQGPYNGGSDRMGLLALWCLTLSQLAPGQNLKEVMFAYLGAQLMLSYLISGWVKVINPDWRSGRALTDVFQFSAYPVSEGLRAWAARPQVMFLMSWAVMLFELTFPLTLVSPVALACGLVIAAAFHLANASLFGLNRFFWTWISVYPALIWLQDRLF